MPRFAANLSMMFTEQPFPERFQAAADAGFEAVEFLYPYEWPADTVAEWRMAAGVEQALFNLSPGDWAKGDRGLASLPGRSGEFRKSVVTALVYAEALGSRRLHVMAGLADPRDEVHRLAYLDALRLASDLAGEKDIMLLIEPINQRDMPGYFLSDFGFAADILDELGRENIKLQFDIYHRQILHGDVLTGLKELMPLIGHVQVASVPNRHEPGSGELNDFRILDALDLLGYDGFVGCEYKPAGTTFEGLDWLKYWACD